MQYNGVLWDGALEVEIWLLDAGGCLRFCQVEGAEGGYVTEDLSPELVSYVYATITV